MSSTHILNPSNLITIEGFSILYKLASSAESLIGQMQSSQALCRKYD